MEIRSIRETPGFAAAGLASKPEGNREAVVRSSVDRVEQTRQWVKQMEDQRKQLLSLLSQPAGKEKKSGGILDMLDGVDKENGELDAMTQQLKMRMKCLEIARRIMQGKKVPIKDEMYLMENDPKGYQLAMAFRKPPKKDEKECESVLDDEDEKSGGTSDSGEAAPVEVSAGGGEPAASGDSGTAES